MKRILFPAIAALSLSVQAPVAAEPFGPRDSARVFVFGNSLIHHLTDTDETTVPHWLAVMARHEGRDFALDGRFGFPREFATELPPVANWNFDAVTPAWDPHQLFASAKFDTIILNPENYIQYDRADKRYPGDNPDGQSPYGATVTVLDWVAQNTDAPRILIYEGWADMHPFADDIPPEPGEMKQYYHHAQMGYARWYDDYVARLAGVRPDADISLLPVGRVMARLLSEEPLSAIAPDALYSDLSPHGTETIYLLAAMITYADLFGVRPPLGLVLPDTIDPDFAAAYETTADKVWDIMQTGWH